MTLARPAVCWLFPEELSDFKGRIKMLEEKNTAFVQKNMELEEVRGK